MEVYKSSDDELELLDYIYPLPQMQVLSKRVNPFDIFEEDKFRERFCFTKAATLKILSEIEHLLEYTSDRNHSISRINQLLVTLRFLATGTFQLIIGDAFGIGKSTACTIIHKVVPIIASLSQKYVVFPGTTGERRRIMQEFYQLSGFPGLIGAIDGTHIPIFSPGGEFAEAYRNRKGYFSFNVQLISNPTLYITDVVARWPGSTHDSTIFEFSHKFAVFETGEIPDGCLIGDSGYPCTNYLLTPLSDPKTIPKQNYNKSHVQARKCIERVNGVLKRRFGILKYGLRVKTGQIPAIIVAAVVLHNIAIVVGEEEPPEDKEIFEFIQTLQNNAVDTEFEQPKDYLPPNMHCNPGNTSQRAAIIRDHFT